MKFYLQVLGIVLAMVATVYSCRQLLTCTECTLAPNCVWHSVSTRWTSTSLCVPTKENIRNGLLPNRKTVASPKDCPQIAFHTGGDLCRYIANETSCTDTEGCLWLWTNPLHGACFYGGENVQREVTREVSLQKHLTTIKVTDPLEDLASTNSFIDTTQLTPPPNDVLQTTIAAQTFTVTKDITTKIQSFPKSTITEASLITDTHSHLVPSDFSQNQDKVISQNLTSSDENVYTNITTNIAEKPMLVCFLVLSFMLVTFFLWALLNLWRRCRTPSINPTASNISPTSPRGTMTVSTIINMTQISPPEVPHCELMDQPCENVEIMV